MRRSMLMVFFEGMAPNKCRYPGCELARSQKATDVSSMFQHES